MSGGIEIGDMRVRKIPGHYAFFVEGSRNTKHEHTTRALAQRWVDRLTANCERKGKKPPELKIVRKYVKAHSYKYSPIYFNF
jgi:hypothetical protein